MPQQLLLVNERDVRQRFELTYDEAHTLLESGAAFFCLADTIKLEEDGSIPVGHPFIAIHAALGNEETRYQMFVNALTQFRTEDSGVVAHVEPEDLNPFTGKVVKVVTPPKGGAEQN